MNENTKFFAKCVSYAVSYKIERGAIADRALVNKCVDFHLKVCGDDHDDLDIDAIRHECARKAGLCLPSR